MSRRTEREITATLLRKIADNIDLLNESQAKTLRTEIESKFRIFSIFEGNGKKAANAIKMQKPGPKVSQSKNLIDYLTPKAPQEITFIVGGLIEKVKERDYNFLPRITLGLKELGFIPENIKKVDIYNLLMELAPGITLKEKENIYGNKKEFCRKLKEYELMAFSKDRKEKAKLELTKKLNAQMINEALQN